MGWRTLPGQCYRNPDIVRSVWKFFRLDDSTPVLWGGGGGGRTQRKTGWARPRGVEQTLSDMPDVDIEHSEDNGRGRRFTNTAVPRFDGTGCWQQHILIFQAIVKSNGWSPVTVALQLFAHLDGEALNVALLMPVKERERWKDQLNGLSEYYNSPGRLAVVRRRFESASRRPEVDQATFDTELGILAVRGFEDMGKRARDLCGKVIPRSQIVGDATQTQNFHGQFTRWRRTPSPQLCRHKHYMKSGDSYC